MTTTPSARREAMKRSRSDSGRALNLNGASVPSETGVATDLAVEANQEQVPHEQSLVNVMRNAIDSVPNGTCDKSSDACVKCSVPADVVLSGEKKPDHRNELTEELIGACMKIPSSCYPLKRTTHKLKLDDPLYPLNHLPYDKLLKFSKWQQAQLACAHPLLERKLRVFAVRRTARADPSQNEADVAQNVNAAQNVTSTHNDTAPVNPMTDANPAGERVEPATDQTRCAEAATLHAQAKNRAVTEADQRARDAERRVAELEAQLLTLQSQTQLPGVRPAVDNVAGTSNPVCTNEAARRADMTQEGDPPAPAMNMDGLRTTLEQSKDDRANENIEDFQANLLKLLSRTVQTQVVRNSSMRMGDIGLSEFSGAHSQLATVIEPEFYPRLLLWLEESESLLRNSGLSLVEQIRALFAHLTGAARKQFISRFRNLDFSTITLNEAREKIFALIPNHQTHFSRAALDMSFNPNRLASDLDKFALYASNGDLPVDGLHFWYRLVQDKLLSACPDVFRLASEHFGKRIEFEPNMTFATMIEKFMDIVLAVQTELKGSLLGTKRPRNDTTPTPKAKQQKAAKPMKSGKGTVKHPDLKDDFNLARAVGMCFGCGKLFPASNTGKRYEKAHNCTKAFVAGVVSDEFSSAISPWRKLVVEGKSKSEIEKIADSKRPKRA